MAKTSKKNKSASKPVESDSVYFLKLVMYLIVGSLWVKIDFGEASQIGLPVGFIIGLAYASRDHFKIDRKIEFALLLVAMLFGFWLPIGLYVSL